LYALTVRLLRIPHQPPPPDSNPKHVIVFSPDTTSGLFSRIAAVVKDTGFDAELSFAKQRRFLRGS